jgi:hypothetical protein
MSNTDVIQVLRILKEYCYSHETCSTCPWYELTEDMGFVCYVNKIVDDERFWEAIGGKR